MCVCVCKKMEPDFSLLLLIVLYALLPKGSNNTNLLHTQCLSESLMSVSTTALSSLEASFGSQWFGVWVLCGRSCKSNSLQHALTQHIWIYSATFLFKQNHNTTLLPACVPGKFYWNISELWSRLFTSAEDHTGCHTCKQQTGNWGYNSPRSPKVGSRRM